MSEKSSVTSEGALPKRRWHTGLTLLLRTCGRTASVFTDHNLGLMVPVFVFLLMFGVLLAFLNTIAPLAPFVYSLI